MDPARWIAPELLEGDPLSRSPLSVISIRMYSPTPRWNAAGVASVAVVNPEVPEGWTYIQTIGLSSLKT